MGLEQVRDHPVATRNPGSSKVVDKTCISHISSLKVTSHLSEFLKFTSWNEILYSLPHSCHAISKQ